MQRLQILKSIGSVKYIQTVICLNINEEQNNKECINIYAYLCKTNNTRKPLFCSVINEQQFEHPHTPLLIVCFPNAKQLTIL